MLVTLEMIELIINAQVLYLQDFSIYPYVLHLNFLNINTTPRVSVQLLSKASSPQRRAVI